LVFQIPHLPRKFQSLLWGEYEYFLELHIQNLNINTQRTIAGSPLSRPPPSNSKANLRRTHTESLLAGYIGYKTQTNVKTLMFLPAISPDALRYQIRKDYHFTSTILGFLL